MNLMMIPNWLMTTMVTMNTTMTGGKDMKRTRIWTMMMTVDRSTYMWQRKKETVVISTQNHIA